MFDIKYTKVKFTLSFKEKCILGENKNSSLRGILGHALMDCNCIVGEEQRNCKKCFFSYKCIASTLMNVKLSRKGVLLDDNGAPPFVIDCDNKQREFNKGDNLEFFITIFGDTVVLTPYIIYAYQFAGISRGIEDGTFNLEKVEMITGEIIFDGQRLYKDSIKVLNLQEYINARKKEIISINSLRIVNPVRFKKEGKLSKTLTFEDLINLLNRRLVLLNQIEDKEFTAIKISKESTIKESSLKWNEQKRYSNRQKQEMSLGGLVGNVYFTDIPIEYEELIISGELLHIGKSTALGLGKYKIQ